MPRSRSDFEFSNETVEWYTPAEIINSARKVLGEFDLDPASCEFANRTVKAKKYFTKEDNSIFTRWYGNVWLNPPSGNISSPKEYGSFGSKSLATTFWNKLYSEYKAGNVKNAIYLGVSSKLLHLSPEYFDHPLCITCSNHLSQCITGSGRIKFVDAEGKMQSSPSHGNFFVLLSEDPEMRENFIYEFSRYGRLVTSITPDLTKHSNAFL